MNKCQATSVYSSRSKHNMSSRASLYVLCSTGVVLKKKTNKKVKKRINVGRAGHLGMTQRLGMSPKGSRLLFD